MSQSQMEFLYQSVVDIQGAIRATDAKIGALLALLILPIGALEKMFQIASLLASVSSSIAVAVFLVFLICGFVASWVLAVLLSFKVLIGIRDPALAIENDVAAKGSFFRPAFAFALWDAISNPKLSKKPALSHCMQDIPENDVEILRELVYEQLKLSYIRDIKHVRHKWAFAAASLWLCLGTVAWYIALWHEL